MLTLDSVVKIPAVVSFGFVEEQVVLLNKQTNQYYRLDEPGARLWGLVKDGKSLREAYQVVLDEYEVEPAQLEQDVLELLDQLLQHGLVELVSNS
jgi:hypothetical protein